MQFFGFFIFKCGELASRSSKDLNFLSLCIETKSWQKPKSWKTKNNSTKSSSQKNPHNKFLPKKSFQKIFPKNFLKKHPSNPLKNSPKNSQKVAQKSPKKSKKKSYKFLKKRFWKYPIPYIALGARKPFQACYSKD